MILEVRPGEGGDDAVDFAKTLFNLMVNSVQNPEIDTTNRIFCLKSKELGKLSTLVGTHRVTRQAKNDKRGRRHTSTVTIALVSDQNCQNIRLNESDLEEFISIGSGNGGQNRQKVATAVTLRHKPTGIEVYSARQRSLGQNKQAARKELLSRLTKLAQEESEQTTNRQRIDQIGLGDRPSKSFTWNYQRGEVIDHTSNRVYPLKRLLKSLDLLLSA